MAHAKSTDPNIFILPDLGEGVHEAEMISWKVKPGDTVKEHDILAEMETDKALVEVPSPRDGVIKTLHGEEGETLFVGNPLVTYEGGSDAGATTGATTSAASTHEGAASVSDRPASASAPAEDEDAGTVVGAMSDSLAGVSSNGKVLAAPAVRRLARDMGIDLSSVTGTGIGGRVTAKDVRAFAEGVGAASPKQPGATSTPTAPAQSRHQTSAPAGSSQGAASVSDRPAPQPTPAPQTARRPLYPQAPAPQFQQQFQQQYQPYSQPQQQPPMGYMPYPPMQPMPAMGHMMPTPYGYMPMPYPIPMPYPSYGAGYGMPPMHGMPGAQSAAGLPHAPGFTPFPSGRPIPDPAQASAPGSRTPFRGVRKTIAQRLRDSVNTAVHFTVVDEADVTELDALRRDVSQQTGVKLSFLPFVGVAVCRALTGRFGALNATVDDAAEEIVQHAAVNLGIATDTDSGLMVPVIPDASSMDVTTLGRSIADTARSARDRSIPRERLMGSTFTISNVGSHAGRFATPVINYPEVGILAVGKAYDGVVVRDGQAAVGKVMPLSLACDHRVVDGATAALCLAEIVAMLQEPGQLL